MPKFILDGKEIEFKPGQTIIQAAYEAGIDIPHFCWHPALSIAGNCRICLVEVEKLPKQVIACATLATENMVVHTMSDKAVHARNAVMEFLLINHPLDCPICDEAGECKLQDYAYKYSVGESRFDETKNHKDKRVELGPNVMLDQERCILCSRCIRFCEEIAKEPELTFAERGEKVFIDTFPDEKLDNPYSMNVIEICPVGALTSKDFRFKARVWDMSHTDSVCVGCARGCNDNIWVRDNKILRLTPRMNLDVNQYWMCDWGRLNTFKHINDTETRVNSPLVRPAEGGMFEDGKYDLLKCDWDDAIARVISEVKNFKPEEIGFVASPFTTLEDNFVLKRFAEEVIGTSSIGFIPKIVENDEDDILIRADKTPNATGLKLLGIKPISREFIDNILNGKLKLVYIIHDSISRLSNAEEMMKKIEVGVMHITNFVPSSLKATVVFPASTYAEMYGTIVNFQGRVQRIMPAVATIEEERLPGDFSVSRLDKFGAHNDKWTRGAKFNARPAWRVIMQVAKAMGHDFNYDNASDVFDDIAVKIPAFSGMDYNSIGTYGQLANRKVPEEVK
ncbi:MAG: NADH-quinone oxidoreductase subunit G [Ignavibacteriae bacterium]|nr:MAG: NADH-quinone oxidoreductase subunit G [Ignavibacteriota bacterium]